MPIGVMYQKILISKSKQRLGPEVSSTVAQALALAAHSASATVSRASHSQQQIQQTVELTSGLNLCFDLDINIFRYITLIGLVFLCKIIIIYIVVTYKISISNSLSLWRKKIGTGDGNEVRK